MYTYIKTADKNIITVYISATIHGGESYLNDVLPFKQT